MMKNNKKKSHKKAVLLILALVIAGGSISYLKYQDSFTKTEEDLSGYKQEKVRRGSVSTGITENGSVTYGTVEQVFEVAEITDSSSDSSSENSSSTSTSSGGSNAGNMGSAGMAAGGMGTGGMNMGSMSVETANSSSGTETTLEVEEVYVKTGQNVSVGDKILKISEESIKEYREQLEAAVKSAQLTVSQEEINLDKKKAEAEYNYKIYLAEGETAEETYNATIKKLEKEISDIEEDIEETRDDIDTYQYYVDCGYDYDEELENAQSEMETLEANLLIAQNDLTTGTLEAKQTYDTALNNYKYADQLHEIDLDGIEDDLNEAKDTLSEAEEALAEFTENIGDGIVYAEYTGTVTEVAYAAGDTITNEESIVTYTDPANVTITVSVSQEDISNISTGMEAGIELDAYKSDQFSGVVDSISTSSSAGSSTVNYEVSVLFSGDISKVYSGMTGNVTFTGESVQDTLYISNKAVYMTGTKCYVKVLDADGNIREQEIKTGFSDGSVVSIESGLEEGEIILIGQGAI